MAQDRYALLVGTCVALSGNEGPFRSCRYCNSTSARVVSGVGPHLGGLTCNSCNRHHSWISRPHLEALLAKVRGDAA